LRIKKALDYGVSNCTLTASQLFNSDMPIARAATIVRNPEKYGFYEVDEDHSIPGTMVISSEPEGNDYIDGGNKYHTMILSGYADRDYNFDYLGNRYNIKKGEPLLNYSRGKSAADNYVKNIPMSVYLDNSDGKTNIRYYRPLSKTYSNVELPEIIIGYPHANGGHLFDGTTENTQYIPTGNEEWFPTLMEMNGWDWLRDRTAAEVLAAKAHANNPSISATLKPNDTKWLIDKDANLISSRAVVDAYNNANVGNALANEMGN
jgi:hypothetical protein